MKQARTAHGAAASGPTPAHAHRPSSRGPRGGLAALSIGALGVVYGDIGTSPLYAVDQLFSGPAAVTPTPVNVLGSISLAIWTIALIVAIKYALLVLRAENDGEGGVFALYGLLHKYKEQGARLLLWSLMLGAGLLFGDGMITPAISVLSAVEGLGVATPSLAPYVIPVTLGLLTALFAIQFKGASRIGVVFGPVLIVWFVVIAALGLNQIVREPQILFAFNPFYGVAFLAQSGFHEALLILGAMMLVVTGGEAMYADLGHFGAKPIRVSWFAIVFPALLANYLGQGALMLSGEPVADGKLFYSMAPASLIYPLVLLATAATVIASQALISGAFSLTAQAIGIGLFPRIGIRHTHLAHAGQIYIPFINWTLYLGCVLLVLGFGSSSALAAAYGLAVAGVMAITSLAMYWVARRYWGWSRTLAILVWGFLGAVNAAFLVASSLKFFEGGFVPLTVGVVAFLIMATWRWGRKATFAAYSAKSTMTLGELIALRGKEPFFLERNALLMAPQPARRPGERAPSLPALVTMLWERNGVLPRNMILVEVIHPKVPYVRDDRYRVTVFDRGERRGCVIGVELSFGFMEEPNVERFLEAMARHRQIDLPADPAQWVVYVAHENLLPAQRLSVPQRLRFRLFSLLRVVSQPAYYAYGLGDEVRLTVEIMPVRVR